MDLVALDTGDQGVLPTRLDPLDRASELPRENGHHDVLRVVHALGPEASADVGRRNDPHVVLGNTELAGEHAAMPMHHLHGAVHGETVPGPARHESARLERMRAAARQLDARAHDDGGGGERSRRVAHTLTPFGDDVVPHLVVQDWRVRREGGVHVDEGGQRLVLDANQVDGVVGTIRVVGDDRGDRLTDEADAVGRERLDAARHGQRRMRRVDRHG